MLVKNLPAGQAAFSSLRTRVLALLRASRSPAVHRAGSLIRPCARTYEKDSRSRKILSSPSGYAPAPNGSEAPLRPLVGWPIPVDGAHLEAAGLGVGAAHRTRSGFRLDSVARRETRRRCRDRAV